MEIEEEGFPPVGVETLNAIPLSKKEFQIDNSPFFVEKIAVGTVVRATPTNVLHKYKFESVLEHSENQSLSIIFLVPEVKETIFQNLKEWGCYCEYGEFGKNNKLEMLAVSIPPQTEYYKIYSFLDNYEKLNQISFSELAIY